MENTDIDRELDVLETALNTLRRDYEIYFSGGTKLPPLESHRRVEREIRRYARLTTLNYAQRFRYNNVSARFNSYVDLWNKQMRNKEEGRTPSGGIIQPVERQREAVKKEPSVTAEANHLQELFHEYLKSRQKTGENTAGLSFEKFSEQLGRQKEMIVNRYQCKDVQFSVAVEQGKTKLKAKPVK
jgi:hypothetical protein